MSKKFVRPLFHSDGDAKHLLQHGYRCANVYENTFGDQFFGTARRSRAAAAMCKDGLPRTCPVYRVVVRLKNV